ncbi:nuclear transport factor 2 family protein [Spongisporangium articulatum]|uniref:Nuclear transport factor 2 family protein n=1 Tax=Spongisporangium articulatum TaxID=3362603 RepID=A0ABW8AUN9_9ACTN
MTEQTATATALAVSHASWACVRAHDRAGWLALMADDVLIEDPIGVAVTNPDGLGVRGKEAAGAFYDANIAPNSLTFDREETFESSDPAEVAHVLSIRTDFGNGTAARIRGLFTYRVDDAGLLTNLRGYWNLEGMRFES